VFKLFILTFVTYLPANNVSIFGNTTCTALVSGQLVLCSPATSAMSVEHIVPRALERLVFLTCNT